MTESNEDITRAECEDYTEIIEFSFQDVYQEISGAYDWTREACISHCEAVGNFLSEKLIVIEFWKQFSHLH